ncbi:hypothetical protein VNI00_004868 [Paramarasmius palmivorus]|uniref:Uncharacterized protein n=1 Tax=Paramarasmius palmivorus TaxID=297713 RepID=A0AAW0DJ75_9AGAR
MSATQPFSAPTFTPRPTITTTTVDPKVIIGAVLGAVLALLCLMVTLVICYRSRGYRVRMRGVYGQGQQSLPQKMVPRAFRRRRDSTDSTLPFARRGFNLEKVDLEKDVGETPPLIKALKAPPSAITAYEHELAKSPTDTLARDSVTYVDSSVSRRASLNTDLSVPSQKQKMRISNQSLTRFMGNRPLDGKLTETRVNVDRDLPELPPLQVPPRQDRYRDDEARYTESLALDPPPAYS